MFVQYAKESILFELDKNYLIREYEDNFGSYFYSVEEVGSWDWDPTFWFKNPEQVMDFILSDN